MRSNRFPLASTTPRRTHRQTPPNHIQPAAAARHHSAAPAALGAVRQIFRAIDSGLFWFSRSLTTWAYGGRSRG